MNIDIFANLEMLSTLLFQEIKLQINCVHKDLA